MHADSGRISKGSIDQEKAGLLRLKSSESIPALVPMRGEGHQFVVYSDSCSGVPGAPHEMHFAVINNVLHRLDPQPEFICFPGDEIQGLVSDIHVLRKQWRYWFEEEMGWLDRVAVPLFHTTGNHTTYDPMSESVYREVMSHLPDNGPPEQGKLSYFVRRDNLLMMFVNTLWSGLGGEGHVETDWLDQVLSEHGDARHKLVFGHHPVFAVNGFSGEYQREIAEDNGRQFWNVLVRHDVLAYVCSHILAFDVQVHEGVLQLLTAGAGTMPRMPPEYEYLHLVQAAIDDEGLRYQVVDTAGEMREWLEWPFHLPQSVEWCEWDNAAAQLIPLNTKTENPKSSQLLVWKFTGITDSSHVGNPQTLLCGWNDDGALPAIWIGLRGVEQRLSVLICPEAGRSPHLWSGPELLPGKTFSIQIAIHTGMGPGGILWSWDDDSPWSSMAAASSWGVERLQWPERWTVGTDAQGDHGQPFRGEKLSVSSLALRIEMS